MSKTSLETLRVEMTGCTKCHLRSQCEQVIPGKGPISQLVIIGEAGGQEEDIMGEPFVGRCGKLLSKLLKDAGINRDHVYVTNTIKCRPPKNRTPSDLEISACKGWLFKELSLIKPKVVLTLGKTPTRLLLRLKKSFLLKSVMGQFHSVDYMHAEVAPWLHPSFLLRNGKSLDDKTVEFFKQVKDKCGL